MGFPHPTHPKENPVLSKHFGDAEARSFDGWVKRGGYEALRAALRERTVVASIGPVTSEALEANGVKPDVHPEHPKMGHLVAAAAQQAGEVLTRKRSAR